MEAQTIEIIRDIIDLFKSTMPDAIKIIGPALITGFVAYKTAKIQYKYQLEKVTENQKFIAREHLLDYYKKKIIDAGEAADSLNLTLGTILGQMAAFETRGKLNKDSEYSEIISTSLSMVNMYHHLSSFEISTTLRDMKSLNLENSEEYQRLKEYQEEAKTLKTSDNIEIIKYNILKLSEIYTFLGRCSQVVLEEQIHKLFGGYLKNA